MECDSTGQGGPPIAIVSSAPPQRSPMSRVAIVGCGGSGKSTLALRLGKLTGLPVVHLDREYWRPGWATPPPAEWTQRVRALSEADRWIIDGNYLGSMDCRFERADTILFLDFHRLLCLVRVLKRVSAYRGRTRPDMSEGCPEKVDAEFVEWIWNFNDDTRPRVLKLIERYRAGRDVFILRSPAEVHRFLGALERGAASRGGEVRTEPPGPSSRPGAAPGGG